MKKLLTFSIAITLCAPCYAAPRKADATKWINEFYTAQANSGDALILNNPAKRKAQMQTVMKLQERAEKMFGQSSTCATAASGLTSVYQAEIELANGTPDAYITASGMARQAWISGENSNECEKIIDGL